MLNFHPLESAEAAKQYYSRAAYYEQEIVGDWGGKGAKKLGLEGQVDKLRFDRLMDNLHPETGEQLTLRHSEDRTPGYDLTFDASKIFSTIYHTTPDEELRRKMLAGFRRSVHRTMDVIEEEAETRVRKGGLYEDRRVGNLTWAEYIHLTTRPAREDGKPDPHVHAHIVVANAVLDPVESEWKAGQFRRLKRDAPYFQALFHSYLAEELRELGFGVERTGPSGMWEIAGGPASVVEKFSRRMQEIQEEAKKRGITDPAAIHELGVVTRQNKNPELGLEELRDYFRGRMTPEEQAALAALESEASGQQGQVPRNVTAKEAMAYAVAHRFDPDHGESIVPERRLLAEALHYGIGSVSLADVEKELSGHGLVHWETHDGQRWLKTEAVIRREAFMVSSVREGLGVLPAINPDWKIQNSWLNVGQQNAVAGVLRSRDWLTYVQGDAGTGKTTMNKELVQGIEAAGLKVVMLAPSTEASRGVQREEGFHDADTLARFLVDPRMQKRAEGGVILLDEASLSGTQQMARLLKIAKERKARVIVQGDVKQHGAVAPGSPLKLLMQEAGLRPIELKEIVRQETPDLKAVVEDLARFQTDDAVKKLDAQGRLVVETDAEKRYERAARAYIGGMKPAKGKRKEKRPLVVAPVHKEGQMFTAAVRQLLKEEGKLGEEREFVQLANMHWSEAERKDSLSYRAGGVVIEFHQNAKGFKRGQRLTPASPLAVPFDQAERFQAFRAGMGRLAERDLIRFTKNSSTLDGEHRINNGSVYRVGGFTEDGNIVLDNGWIVSKDIGHWRLGYYTSSHSSQSRTADEVIHLQSGLSAGAASREQFYVSISRAKRNVTVFTDNQEALKTVIARPEDQTVEIDLSGWRNRRAEEHIEFLRRLAAQVRAIAGQAKARVQELARTGRRERVAEVDR